MTDWRAAYNGLSRAGYTDDQIADFAGRTRAVINGVRNGTYRHPHEPSHSGGVRVLAALDQAVANGWLDKNPLEKP